MFFYFFQFIFHANNQLLDVMIIGFGTHGIDFATDLLGDKSEFTSRGFFFLHGFDKIFTMICQTNFLFRDIQFLQVIDNLLSIFIKAPSVETLRQRLIGRGTDSMEKIEQRVAKAEYEMTFADKFDVVIVNDNLDTALAEAEKAVRDFLK